MVEKHDRAELFNSWHQEAQTRRDHRPLVTFKAIPPVIYFLQPNPASESFHHLPK
jgi:hypothetical protein